jgi:hypothetical protein
MAGKWNEMSRTSELEQRECKMRDTKPAPTTNSLGHCDIESGGLYKRSGRFDGH